MSDAASSEKPRVDELIARTQKFVLATLEDTVEKPVAKVGKRIGSRLVRFVVSAALLVLAAAFLLVGLVTMLMQWIPTFAACLIVGVVALLFGLIFLVL